MRPLVASGSSFSGSAFDAAAVGVSLDSVDFEAVATRSAADPREATHREIGPYFPGLVLMEGEAGAGQRFWLQPASLN